MQPKTTTEKYAQLAAAVRGFMDLCPPDYRVVPPSAIAHLKVMCDAAEEPAGQGIAPARAAAHVSAAPPAAARPSAKPPAPARSPRDVAAMVAAHQRDFLERYDEQEQLEIFKQAKSMLATQNIAQRENAMLVISTIADLGATGALRLFAKVEYQTQLAAARQNAGNEPQRGVVVDQFGHA